MKESERKREKMKRKGWKKKTEKKRKKEIASHYSSIEGEQRISSYWVHTHLLDFLVDEFTDFAEGKFGDSLPTD